MNMHHGIADSQLGPITIAADSDTIVGIFFEGHWTGPKLAAIGPEVAICEDSLLGTCAAEITEYLAGTRLTFSFPTATRGNPFQEKVWAILRTIPRGDTVTYGWIATQLGDPKMAQAVGQAVGHNPLSIVVPCHRVIGSDGSLTGYAGGLDRKVFLLALEESEETKSSRLF